MREDRGELARLARSEGMRGLPFLSSLRSPRFARATDPPFCSSFLVPVTQADENVLLLWMRFEAIRKPNQRVVSFASRFMNSNLSGSPNVIFLLLSSIDVMKLFHHSS